MSKGLVSFKSAKPNSEMPEVMDVSADELKQMADQVHLIDVRRPDEFVGELGHIENARPIVLDTLPDHVNELPKGETIVFICRSGARSARAASWAQEEGFARVFNMEGGMLRWKQLGFPIKK